MPLLVVADDPRRAGGEHQRAAALGQIGLQQADLVRVGCALNVDDELVDRVRRDVDALASRSADRPSRSARMRSSRCGAPRAAGRTRRGRGPSPAGTRRPARAAGSGSGGSSKACAGGATASSTPGPFCAPTHRRGSCAAVSALIRICPALAAFSMRATVEAAGPTITCSRCDSPTSTRWKSAAVDSLRDPQRHARRAGRHAADLAQRRCACRRPRGTRAPRALRARTAARARPRGA